MPKEPRKVGLVEGKFYPCPEKHVCVSTQAPQNDEIHYIEPIIYEGSKEEALTKIKNIIKSMKRTKIIEEKQNYLRVIFNTALFRFKDDVEFLFYDNNNIIDFRSQSRIGGYDWNANRNRMEKIRSLFKI